MKSLEEYVNSELEGLAHVTEEFPWENKQAYAYWLAQTYYFVRHSTRILALAASRFDFTSEGQHRRFLEHVREEGGHERLALSDLKKLGMNVEAIPELCETSAFYQIQYYWIEHIHPIALFGFILGLEGIAVKQGASVYRRVTEAHGEAAAHFLRVHSVEDVGHLDVALTQVKNLKPEERGLILKNLKVSCALYKKMLTEIVQRVRLEEVKKAS